MSNLQNEVFEESKREAELELIELFNKWFLNDWISYGEYQRLTGTADF